MVEGRPSGGERHCHRRRDIDRHRELESVHAWVTVEVTVLEHLGAVGTGHERHAAVGLVAVVERHPHPDGVEPLARLPVRLVLVPRRLVTGARRLVDHVTPHLELGGIAFEQRRGDLPGVAQVRGGEQFRHGPFREQRLREEVGAVGFIGPGEIEVAALDTATAFAEEAVVDVAQPHQLFVGGDALDRREATVTKFLDHLRTDLDPQFGRREWRDRNRHDRMITISNPAGVCLADVATALDGRPGCLRRAAVTTRRA